MAGKVLELIGSLELVAAAGLVVVEAVSSLGGTPIAKPLVASAEVAPSAPFVAEGGVGVVAVLAKPLAAP